MHESALAKNILEVVLAKAREANARKVTRVVGWVAEDEALSHDALSFNFDAHARGSLAEGAKLDLELRVVLAECASCQHQYLPDHHLMLCPRCGSTEGKLLGETGIGIDTVQIER